MVSSTPAGSGLPIGLMPGALPSDHASRQTLKTTAIFLPCGQTQFTCCLILHCAPIVAGRRGGAAVGGVCISGFIYPPLPEKQHVGWAKAARELPLMHRARAAVPTRIGTAKRSRTPRPPPWARRNAYGAYAATSRPPLPTLLAG